MTAHHCALEGVKMRDPRAAHKVLAAIRICNGAAGLLYPEFLLRRLRTDPRIDRSGIYPFRMFGVRTLLIGLELLTLSGEDLRRASNRAVLIHACDTLSAASAGLRGDLPRRAGVATTLISATNTALAIVAARKPAGRGRPRT
jgi:hypothetical protein